MMMQEQDASGPLKIALARLMQEFPSAGLYEVRLGFASGVRVEPSDNWTRVSWTIQVGNDSESGNSVDAAFVKLRARLDLESRVPALAERVAAVLREMPDNGFFRGDVLRAAELILNRKKE